MSTFRVMTWNLENLFQVGKGGPKTEPEYQEKLQSLAKVIRELNPDVLAMQEVGSEEALSDLLALLSDYPYQQLSIHPDIRGIRVGFISKLEIKEHEDIIDFPDAGLPKVPGIDSKGNFNEVSQLSRGALRILVEPAGMLPVHCITAHFKSKLLSFPSTTGKSRFKPRDENERARVAGIALLKRTAEAVALRIKANEILEKDNTQAMVLLGDFNDVVNAATTQILNGPSGSQIGTPGFVRSDAGDDTRLFNLAPLITEARRYSRINQGNKELIDHLFASQELLLGDAAQLPTVDSHIDIFGKLPSVTPDPSDRKGKPASDHAPVTATFELS